jgi:hypothetical protein
MILMRRKVTAAQGLMKGLNLPEKGRNNLD